jgi:ubiquinone/menaquinone biosynthesis C-methylase UbiE
MPRPRKVYARKAETYDQEMINKFGEHYFKVIRKIVELVRPRSEDVVLDMGAGTGAVSFALAPYVKKVIAVDISEQMLNEAKRKAEDSNIGNIDFVVGDFLHPNVEGTVDVIVSNIALHHLTDEEKEKAVKIMAEKLNDGGRLVLGDVIIFFDTTQKQADEVLNVIQEYMGRGKSRAIKELREVFSKKHPARFEDLERMIIGNGLKIEKVEKIFSIIGVIKAVKTASSQG